MPFTAKIIETARKFPQQVALAEGSVTVTYRALVRDSPVVYAGVRAVLAEQDARSTVLPDTPADMQGLSVVVISVESALNAAKLMAILAGYGIVTTIMDPLWPTAHRMRAVQSSGARIVVTDDDAFTQELVDAGWPGTLTSIDELYELGSTSIERGIPAQEPSIRPGHEPYCLIFTSGTTDLPKAFLRTRDAWRYNVAVSRRYLKAERGVTTLAPGPLAYSLTLYGVVESLGTGGSIWLQSRFDAIEAASTIEQQQLERLVAVPAVLPALAAAARRRPEPLPNLRDAIVGGANLSAAVREAFETAVPSAKVLSYYGAAEIGFIGQSLNGEGNVLEPFSGVELSVRDEQGQPVEAGELGQLFVRVPSQGDRYITSGAPAITGPDGWSTVDDMARFDGCTLVLEGRAGDIAITGGHKVSLLQVERAFDGIGYERASVVTQPDASLGEILVAVIEVRDGEPSPEKKALTDALRGLLAPQFVPRRFYVTNALPRTVGGKVRRVEVQDELDAGHYRRL